MKKEFWHQRWGENKIGFHQTVVHPLLIKNIQALSIRAGDRIFLPLCGKTLDINWLLSNGYSVCGVELSELAVEQLFANLALTPAVSQLSESLKCYSSENLDVLVGDIFELTADVIGTVDAIYDRAALVALPDDMRRRYATHLPAMTGCAQQLLIAFEYDQSLMSGPPFSVDANTVVDYYSDLYDISLIEKVAMPDGLKGQYPATELVWLLSEKT